MYVNRKYIVEFLAMLVFSNDHSNVLEDFLYVCFTANEYIAMTRANAVIDLLDNPPPRAESERLARRVAAELDWPVICSKAVDRLEAIVS